MSREHAERLAQVREQIADACRQAGRRVEDIRLIAVSKTKTWEEVASLTQLGVTDFGENYVQEALEKIAALENWRMASAPSLSPPRWHFIGTLQSNKAKFIPGNFWGIHSLETGSLAQKLDAAMAKRGGVLPCLVEVNVDGEGSKGGAAPDELARFLSSLAGLKHLEVRGLMCIPSVKSRDPRAPFARLRELRDELNRASAYPRPLRDLSMGMSEDFPAAILEGATMIRVGTRLFGARVTK